MWRLYTLLGEGNGTPLQYSCLENPMDGGAWWATVHGVAKSRTRFHFHFHISTFLHWRRKWQPTPVFLPGESQERQSLEGWTQLGLLPRMWAPSLAILEKAMAPHSSVLAWKIPWMEELGGLSCGVAENQT